MQQEEPLTSVPAGKLILLTLTFLLFHQAEEVENSKVGFANSVTVHLFGILANLLKNNVNIKECKIS